MSETIGKITIAPGVLVTIVRLTALQQPGVARLSPREPSRSWARVRGRGATANGIGVWVSGGQVHVEVRVVADGTVSAPELGAGLQKAITQAIEEMVGMPVAGVAVYIDDVDVSKAKVTR